VGEAVMPLVQQQQRRRRLAAVIMVVVVAAAGGSGASRLVWYRGAVQSALLKTRVQ